MSTVVKVEKKLLISFVEGRVNDPTDSLLEFYSRPTHYAEKER